MTGDAEGKRGQAPMTGRPGGGIILPSADTGADSVDTATAAEELKVSPRTVRRYISSGLLTGHEVDGTFGREWRVTRPSLDRLRAEKERGRADSRRPSDRPALRTDSAVMRQLDANTGALLQVAEGLEAVRALTGLPEDLQALRTAVLASTEATAALAGQIAEENVRLRARAEAAEAEADDLRAQVTEVKQQFAEERGRPWWSRLRRR